MSEDRRLCAGALMFEGVSYHEKGGRPILESGSKDGRLCCRPKKRSQAEEDTPSALHLLFCSPWTCPPTHTTEVDTEPHNGDHLRQRFARSTLVPQTVSLRTQSRRPAAESGRRARPIHFYIEWCAPKLSFGSTSDGRTRSVDPALSSPSGAVLIPAVSKLLLIVIVISRDWFRKLAVSGF